MNVKHKKKALNSVKNLLKKDGSFILCDTLILFDPYENQELFNKTYRYLLEKTTPKEIYKKYKKNILKIRSIYGRYEKIYTER